MKFRFLLIIGTALLVCSCSLAYQSTSGSNSSSVNTTTSTSASTGGSSTSGSGSLTSKNGYQPSQDDVNRYNNDVKVFLKAKMNNDKAISNAAVIIDDKVVSDISVVKLSDVKNISVIDKAPSITVGDKTTRGAIVIKTK